MSLFYNSLQRTVKVKGMKRKFNFISLIFLVQSLLFSLAYGIPQGQVIKVEVVTELANIRAEPDIGSPIIHLASQGTAMDVLGQEGPWYHIRITIDDEKTIEGYVHESLVKKVQSITPVIEKKEEEKPPQKVEGKKIPIKKEKVITSKPVPEPSTKKIPTLTTVSQIHINITGGANYSLVGDINEGAEGFIEYYRSTLGAEKTGEFQPLHLYYIFGGDVSVPLGSGFHFGIGADYFLGKKETSINFSQPASVNIQTQPEIKVLPVRIFLSYHVSPAFYIKGGIEYIFTDCSYLYRLTENDTWQEWSGKADSGQIGGLLGLGFVHDFGRLLSVFIEASGRYAVINDLKGEGIYRDSTGYEYKEKGYLYIYQGEVPNKDTFPLVFVRDKTPSGYGVSNPERASLDLSGLSLQAGIRIKFSLFK